MNSYFGALDWLGPFELLFRYWQLDFVLSRIRLQPQRSYPNGAIRYPSAIKLQRTVLNNFIVTRKVIEYDRILLMFLAIFQNLNRGEIVGIWFCVGTYF